MSVVEIENRLVKMTNSERRIVIKIVAKLIREDSNTELCWRFEEKRAKLRQSAEMMLSEYKFL